MGLIKIGQQMNLSQLCLLFYVDFIFCLVWKNTDCLVGIGNDRIEFWQLWIASSLGCFASTYFNNRVMQPRFFFQKWPGCHVWFEKIKGNERKGKEVKEKEIRRKKNDFYVKLNNKIKIYSLVSHFLSPVFFPFISSPLFTSHFFQLNLGIWFINFIFTVLWYH